MSDVWGSAVNDYINGAAGAAAAPTGSPERTAKALRLAERSGIPATVIDLDIEGYDKRIQAQENASLVRSSPALQQFLGSSPEAGKVASDDLAKLKAYADAIDAHGFGRGGRAGYNLERAVGVAQSLMEMDTEEAFRQGGPPARLVQAVIDAAAEGFGLEQLGLTPGSENSKFLSDIGLGPGTAAYPEIAFVAGTADIATRALNAVLSGGVGGLTQLAVELGIAEPKNAEQLKADLEVMGQMALIHQAMPEVTPLQFSSPLEIRDFLNEVRARGRPPTPQESAARARGGFTSAQARAVTQFVLESPEAFLRRAKLDLAALDATVKAAQESATRARAPDQFHTFAKQQVGDRTISVPAEAAATLYAEKAIVPKPGDEILGFTPDVAKQVEVGLASGGDVEVPLAGYLAHVKPEVHTALAPDLRVKGGPTVTEATGAVKEADTAPKNIITAVQPPSGGKPPSGPTEPSEESSRKALFLSPLFADAKSAGMTEPEFAKYSDRLSAWRAANEEKRRLVAEHEARRDAKVANAEATRIATEAFDTRRDVVAEALLRSSGAKLDAKIVDPTTVPRGLTSPDGVAPDEVAAVLGFKSGGELLRDLEGLHADRGELGPTDYRADSIKRAASAEAPLEVDLTNEVFSEPLSRVLYDDLRVMQRQIEGEGSAPLNYDELRSWAARNFSEMPISRARKAVDEYSRNVAKGGRAAELALLGGDVQKAFRAKNQQLVSHFFAKEAVDFSKELVKGDRLMARYSSARRPPSIPAEYWNQIQRILVQQGVPVRRPLGDLAQEVAGSTLETFIAEREDLGYEIPVADFLLDSAFAKPIKDLTVDEYRRLVESIQSLEHNARLENTALKGAERMEVAALQAEIVDNVTQLPLRFPRGQHGRGEAIKSVIYAGDALLVKPEELIDDLDRRDSMGPLNQSLLRPLIESKHAEDQLLQDSAKKLQALPAIKNSDQLIDEVPWINPITAEGTNPGIPFRLTRGDVAMMALNLGSKENRVLLAKTLLGEDRVNLGEDSAVQSILDQINSVLTEQDWAFVEGLWTFFKDLKPQIDEMYRRLSGVPPSSVGPVPVQTPFGVKSGGYSPILHDPVVSDVSLLNTPSPFARDYHRATVKNNYTKARTGVFKPIIVERAYDMLAPRILEMIHDLTFREAIVNANKILRLRPVRAAISKHYGPEYNDTLDPWLQYVANRYNTEDMQLKGLSNWLRWARRNLVVQALGFNARVILTPNLGPLLKDLAVSPLEVAQILRHPKKYWDFALANSAELRHRLENTDRDMSEVLQNQLGAATREQRVKNSLIRASMYAAVRIDTWLAMMSWMKEYNRAYRTGQTYFGPLDTMPLNHEDAVYVADKLVRKFFGSAGRTDLAAIMRGSEPLKISTMFYGFQGTMYNRSRDVVQVSKSGVRRLTKGDNAGARRDFSTAIGMAFMFVGLTALFGYAYAPQVVGDDDSWGDVAGKLLLGQLLALFPLARDVSPALLRAVGFSDVPDFPSRPSPLGSLLANTADVVHDSILALSGDDPGDKWIKHALNIPGYVLGLPTGQIANDAQYLWNLSTGQDEAQDLGQFLNGLIYGRTTK